MPDRRRRSRLPQTNSLVASAQVITSSNAAVQRSIGAGKAHDWQAEAWDFYDTVGEFRFAVAWISNALSRVNLAAARPPDYAGGEPVLIDIADPEITPAQRRAAEIVAMMAGGPTGQGQLLGEFGIHLPVAGIGYLVAEPSFDNPETDAFDEWQVLASEEIRDSTEGIQIRVTDREWRPVHPNAVVVKVWRKHPRRSWLPDAPTRGVLAVLREINLLTMHIQASAQSRLAGAGLLAIPSEAVFPPGQGPQSSQDVDPTSEDITPPEDNFVETLIDAMTTPLTDRGSAAAVVPLVIKVPGDLVDKIRHTSFNTPFDDRVQSLLENAIKRLALGMDIPPEILTGTGGMNHWGAWQVAEEALTLHVEPLAETVTHALTIGFLRPALIAEGYNPDEAMVWYDTSDLRTRPDKSKGAVEAYDRQELSATAMLRELGLSADDLPTEEERRERILLDLARSVPALAPGLLADLGYLAPVAAPAIEQAPIPEQPALEAPAPEEQGAPIPLVETVGPPEERPTEPDLLASARAEGLSAACDLLVRRALERAGARLRSAAGKRQPGGAASVPCEDPARLYLEIDATAFTDLDSLLDGAWAYVPEIAERYSLDAESLTRSLDGYTRSLIAAREPHEYGTLSHRLPS